MTTTASSKFMVGPMIRTWNRCHLISRGIRRCGAGLFEAFAGHLHAAAERNQLMLYSVSPRLIPNTGLKLLKFEHANADAFRAMKWPSS